LALTFVNQVGAVEGMNQAAPGTLIPDSFVRFSQDVLFDRAGLMRRRGPFEKFKMYNNNGTENTDGLFSYAISGVDDERVLAVLSTYDPTGAERIGMLVDSYDRDTNSRESILRVFDNNFKYLGYEKLPFDITPLSIVSAKPALGGGLWVSVADDPADADSHYQFFWRGGYNTSLSGITGTFSTEAVTGVSAAEHQGLSPIIDTNSVTGVSVGQFVYASVSGSDYYLGTVKAVDSPTTSVTLEKRPFLWSATTDNNHNVSYTINSSNANGGLVRFNLSANTLFEAGDVIIVSGHSVTAYNTTHTIQSVSGSAVTTTTTHTTNGTGGTMHMNNDFIALNKTSISLKFLSVRPYTHVHGRGLLTVADAGLPNIVSGSVGTSAEGHWQAANIRDYNLYRASDNFYIGKVKTVTDNATAALWSDSGIKLAGEEYIMRSTDATNLSAGSTDYCVGSSDNTIMNFAGLYTAVYAGYQWYGNFGQDDENTNRVVFSASHDREAVDLSRDAADSIIFPGKSKFRGLGASSAGLLVFLEDRTYILRGNDRTNFSVEQLVPEGCLCASSIVEYGGGVFWAGKSGIMFFDGASVRNLTKDNLGLYYTDSLDVFNPDQDRVIGFMHKNNLIMHYTSWKAPFDPIRYEPIYAEDWLTTPGIMDRAWDEFDPDFDYDDFFTQNNTPIFWDQKKLNNPEESATTGQAITWNSGADWGSPTSLNKWGPLRKNTSITFAVYLPTNAVTTLSNMDFRGVTAIETLYGLKTIVGVNSVESETVSYDTTNKELTSNVATLTIGSHNLKVGDTIVVANVDSVFNGTYTISALTSTTVSYAKTNANIVSTAITDGSVTRSFTNALRGRFIDVHPVFDVNTNGEDTFLVEKINIPYTDLVKGPDFYMQTKHFTVGDPILRKWFQRIMLSMLLYDGAIRMDLVDDDDNDSVDINKKKHKYWELFTEKGYDWSYLTDIQFPKIVSPNKATWENVEGSATYWDELFTADFNRYSKRVSWRKPSVGFRLYQLNEYKKPFNGVVTRPNRVEIQGFSIGFKPLRQGRI
jgi:hypothetical protein